MAKQLIIKGIEKCYDCPYHNETTTTCHHPDGPYEMGVSDKPTGMRGEIPSWCPLPEDDK